MSNQSQSHPEAKRKRFKPYFSIGELNLKPALNTEIA
jgi:hypothetical protein